MFDRQRRWTDGQTDRNSWKNKEYAISIHSPEHMKTHTHTPSLHHPSICPSVSPYVPSGALLYSRRCRVCIKRVWPWTQPHPNTHSHTPFISKKSLIFLFPSNAIISWKQSHQGVQFDQFISQPTFPSLSEVTYPVVHMHQYAGGFMKIISLPPVSQWKWMSIKDDITQALQQPWAAVAHKRGSAIL